MLTQIYNCIKKRIIDNLDWVNSVDIYQNQDIFQDQSLGFKPPVVFIDFQDIEYTTLGFKSQRCDLTIVVKLVVEDYTRNYLKVLCMKDELNQYLNFWSDWNTQLERISEQTDNNADSLYVFDISYDTSFLTEDFTWDKIPIGGTDGNAFHGTSGRVWGIDIDVYLNHTFGTQIQL